MKLMEFEALAPKCIVCGAKMKRIVDPTFDKPSRGTNAYAPVVSAKYYHINMICARDEKCFGYMSNAVSIHDPIVVKRFYIGFQKIQLFAEVGEYIQVNTNGSIMKLQYIPFETFLKCPGQVYEKLEKLLILADGT